MEDRSTGWVRFDWMLESGDFSAPVPQGYGLRAAMAGDVPAMLNLVAVAYASDSQWEGMTADIERRVGARIRERIGDPTAYFVVAETAGRIVGLNGVAVESPTGMNLITGICVDPAHQGRGLGAALLGNALAWLCDQGVECATVTTDGKSAAARVYARFDAIRTVNVDFPDPPTRPVKLP